MIRFGARNNASRACIFGCNLTALTWGNTLTFLCLCRVVVLYPTHFHTLSRFRCGLNNRSSAGTTMGGLSGRDTRMPSVPLAILSK